MSWRAGAHNVVFAAPASAAVDVVAVVGFAGWLAAAVGMPFAFWNGLVELLGCELSWID